MMAVAGIAIAGGCGDSPADPRITGCAATITLPDGRKTLEACVAEARFDAGDLLVAVTSGGLDSSDPQELFVLFWGTEIAPRTYNLVSGRGSVHYGPDWLAGSLPTVTDSGPGLMLLGSATLNVSSLTALQTTTDGTRYQIHGTLDATLVPDPQNPPADTTGTVTVHAVF
jgi:hypothetical protein